MTKVFFVEAEELKMFEKVTRTHAPLPQMLIAIYA